MPLKTIVAVLSTAADAEKVTAHAIALAGRYGAHLIGIHAETPIVVTIAAPMEFPDPNAILEMQNQARAESTAIEAVFRDRAARDGLSHEWRLFTGSAGYAGAAVTDSARTADLVVSAQLAPDYDGPHRADIEDLIYESGRPIYMLSNATAGPEAPRRALLAWNGSREAARAAFDALPLLQEAGKVEILTVDAEDSLMQTAGFNGTEIAAALARHGVAVDVTTLASAGRPVAEVINRRASEIDANLIVMGAFSHSWLRQRLFGGVTSAMMRQLRVPALMAR
ncbi:universal stress protein [Rhizobium sp. TRM95111]|uniref:universal stress protein n=1 Tax=Rhizobium alarense TaxID=2846851 RepID=UPI001F1F6857|nr:universal stress protein [Rhizobium alarense]MCF3640075.1 universal stress protein [Rhizobium alarense]